MNPDNWQPIDTAPKDGAEILVCYTRQSNNPVSLVYFLKSHGYWLSKGVPCTGLEQNATHWMPLPDPPSDASVDTQH